MEMAFSRGLYTGWFRGTNNQALVHGRFGKKRGVYLGEVIEVRPSGVVVDLQGLLKPGDGVVFDAGKPEENEEGGRVYEMRSPECGVPNRNRQESPASLPRPGSLPLPPGRPVPDTGREAEEEKKDEEDHRKRVLVTFGRGDINFNRVHVGDKLWKTSDPELERRLRQSFEGGTPRFRRPIALEVHGHAGKPLVLIGRDELGHVISLVSTIPLAGAHKQPLTTTRLREQFGRLGGTAFRLGELQNHLEGDVLLPVRELNRLRRELVKELEIARAAPSHWTLRGDKCRSNTEEALTSSFTCQASLPTAQNPSPHLIVLVRNLAQLEAALKSAVETIYCEFEDPKKYREAVARVRAVQGGSGALGTARPAVWVAPPRIFKMGEEWTLNQVRSCDADGYLVRNYDHLNFFSNHRRIGDYSLNIANRLAADYFKNKFGLERVTASYDLNCSQLEALLQRAPPEWFEITIHQHMPMFHMEHCVFCAFLSKGTDYTNCGRPCDKHDLKLRDRVGAQHPVKADVGCRNTVFNSLAQTGAEYVQRMLALGVRHFRLEFLNETPAQVEQTIDKYRQLLRGEISGAQLWKELKLFNQLGVTRGQMAGAQRQHER